MKKQYHQAVESALKTYRTQQCRGAPPWAPATLARRRVRITTMLLNKWRRR
jgi:hypothetical protein